MMRKQTLEQATQRLQALLRTYGPTHLSRVAYRSSQLSSSQQLSPYWLHPTNLPHLVAVMANRCQLYRVGPVIRLEPPLTIIRS
ncbi:hypothetical protein KR51_00001460 [Rubidibacter lacunae KORDI 51-2]|uniref:Uncharacterized protein n=1 Tax=Rubidibacter lacunae KORDI 51-2 TaxID=582515 RepID=U5DR51_9CHRO|nr:hypothetical protein KR51_00001460 [Rubidibacter lacunae KORDI 51-2]